MNKAKIKGTWAENQASLFFARWFPSVERRALAGTLDKGDLINVGPYVVSVKHHKAWRCFQWLDELRKMRVNAKESPGFIMARRPHHQGFIFIVPQDVMVNLLDSVYGNNDEGIS